MSRTGWIAIAVVGVFGLGAAFFLLRASTPVDEATPAAPSRERPTEPAPRQVESARPLPPPPSGPKNFAVQILAPNGGAPGHCWVELKAGELTPNGPIDDGHADATVPAGQVTATAACVEGYGHATFTAPDLAARLQLEPNAILSVDVQWSDGKPAAGVEVSAEIQQSVASWFERFTERNARGQVRTIRRLTTALGHVELAMAPSLLAVSASDGRTALYPASDASSDPRGVLPSGLVEPGAAGVRAGLARTSASIDLRKDPIQRLVLTLPRGRSLSGTVVDEAQKPVAGLELKAFNAEEPAGPQRAQQVVVTDGSGRFFLEGAPATVNLSGTRVTAVVGPGTATVTLVQRQARSVDGRVVHSDGGVAAGVVIDGAQPTRPDGTFSFEVDPGEERRTFEFWIKPTAARKLVTVELTPGVTHLGDVMLDEAP